MIMIKEMGPIRFNISIEFRSIIHFSDIRQMSPQSEVKQMELVAEDANAICTAGLTQKLSDGKVK